MSDDPIATRELGSELLGLANDQGFPAYITTATIITGWAIGRCADVHAGIAQLQRGLNMIGKGSMRYFMSCQLCLLTQLYLQSGDIDSAMSTLGEAGDLVKRSDETLWEAEIHRLTGDALCAADKVSFQAAQAEYERALDVSRRTGAKSLELRATMGLARLWDGQGRREEARESLQSMYEWFTEGFETPDLKAASSLLSELA
ncbi:MAG: hypothetical protein GWN21_15705 [Gammaproteobacteria bacterium]|nr:hypothetical protein [Gammaproteobacteria bacterium]NIP89759.1 hypothetical protein [Gammaproteobacteria bacterium]NIR24621.1 hypothetical protein [Gammaproteobacteria bacterium]NIS06235.1 hypothetical protein [Gammaproteobacteria bacterium]NIV48987.1 hypothetical protein [Gammaproteobacteria bacterium]